MILQKVTNGLGEFEGQPEAILRLEGEEALSDFDKAIELKPDYPEAWFNKACLYGLNGNAKLAIQNLKKSIEINAIYRERAKTDSYFDNIRNDQEFKQLIEDI